MERLTAEGRQLINRFQGGFPTVRHPFRYVAATLGMGETALIDLVDGLVKERWLSRFGPVYDASRIGGGQTLAALEVPEERFDAVAALVNGFDEVAHNYRREHRLNMWFVVAAERGDSIPAVLAAIARETALAVYDFPKLNEFYLGLKVYLGDDGAVDTVPADAPGSKPGYVLDAVDRALVVATQAGLPLAPEPWEALAGMLGCDEGSVRARLESMLEYGVIRRIGAVPNHYRLGLTANGMTVWDVPDELLEDTGAAVARLPFVSHCYERTRHPGIWPYNLFAMVHGASQEEVAEKTARIAAVLGGGCRGHDVLVSSACLKKTGLRLAA